MTVEANQTNIATTGEVTRVIRTRERLDNMELPEVKALCEAELGKPNRLPIGDNAAGTLKAVAVTADGGPFRWRIFYEWEPV